MDPSKKHKKMLGEVVEFFDSKIKAYGPTAKGLDFNSDQAQKIRFDQLLKVIEPGGFFSVNDYGCGFGSLAKYMQELGYQFEYTGFDISPAMIDQAHAVNSQESNWIFGTELEILKPADYTLASGIFNLRFRASDDDWKKFIVETIHNIADLSKKGFAFNMLTIYSDPDKMRSDLYYGDPLFFFDYCKRNFSRNVALLHDYGLYDFTIVVRYPTRV